MTCEISIACLHKTKVGRLFIHSGFDLRFNERKKTKKQQTKEIIAIQYIATQCHEEEEKKISEKTFIFHL